MRHNTYKMILNEFKKGCKTCFMGRLLIFNRNLTMSHINKSITCFVSGQEGKQLADLYDSLIQNIYIHIYPNAEMLYLIEIEKRHAISNSQHSQHEDILVHTQAPLRALL